MKKIRILFISIAVVCIFIGIWIIVQKYRNENMESSIHKNSINEVSENDESSALDASGNNALGNDASDSASPNDVAPVNKKSSDDSHLKSGTVIATSGNAQVKNKSAKNHQDISPVDTVKPQILYAPAEKQIKAGGTFEPKEIIGYGDNQDSDPDLEITGYVNTNVIGSYPISYKVTDDAGNSVSGSMTVKVVPSVVTPQPSLPEPQFSEFMQIYAGDNHHFGIDVSAWQGNIDFDKVKQCGAEFVFIRIANYENGELVPDKYFQSNIKNAAASGLKVGVYFYTTDSDEKTLRAHADWIASQLGNYKLDLPVAYDWEDFSEFGSKGISLQEFNDLYAEFADEMNQKGYDTMLYSSKNFLYSVWMNQENHWGDSKLGNLQKYNSLKAPVWLANYAEKTDYTGKYWIWQQGYGHIAGIDGVVDFNVMYGETPE